ncbi:hypothetical protein Slin15195_G033390 [Septoria linicola]|uniref:Uncharacterized protein n=1 Tax=Septoria linicola TaxID=215465 RepID=A0A9Q9AP66_9PEZI|nr:hypothetical protein Slin14017_G032420 [Septoria linicola]USW50020.1 hypothetical protein Slin15195_G033390 [Septoria linicola]
MHSTTRVISSLQLRSVPEIEVNESVADLDDSGYQCPNDETKDDGDDAASSFVAREARLKGQTEPESAW